MADSKSLEMLREIYKIALLSREIDLFEEKNLYPKEVPYQFSSKGHELTQIILAKFLDNPQDAVCTYYRGRALLLGLGLSPIEAFRAALAKADSYSGGRDIGVVSNLKSRGGATVLPTAGDVGAQYTPASGWAAAIKYYSQELAQDSYCQAIAVAHGGDGSVASNGFWAALNIATTRILPMLFFIEDNGYAISVKSDRQVPGGNIAKNLASYGNLKIYDVDSADPIEAFKQIEDAIKYIRTSRYPALIRLVVYRLSGHSGQDTQAYKTAEIIERERSQDLLTKLANYLELSAEHTAGLKEEISKEVLLAYTLAKKEAEPLAEEVRDNLFGQDIESKGSIAKVEGSRVNLVDAIRNTLLSEMKKDEKIILLGEDIGVKGGVHTATMGLRGEFGEKRVVDTSLSEEGIVGNSVGLALAGLRPVPEIQFRKYADAATEQLVNCGTIRWRTNSAFSAPLVVRIPVGVARKVGDPWHSVSGESIWAHQVGWYVAMPSNVVDATGLLRAALRGPNPVLFFEHRALLDSEYARGVYPGDDFVLPFGVARVCRSGSRATVVTWGYMLERCEQAIEELGEEIELIDLRSIVPWDRKTVLSSVEKTGRLLIVHEDLKCVGFGAEIAAVVADEGFRFLDSPVLRLAVEDIPVPYNPVLTNAVVPSVDRIKEQLTRLLSN